MMILGKYLGIVLQIGLVFIPAIKGHGILKEPPGRSSMWRFGFSNPTNYNDNQLYCGGRDFQIANGGQCGLCGDPFNENPRQNEAGGRYANGIIVRTYTAGSTIGVTVQITANHLGWFEFRLCANNNIHQAITQACLDQYLLRDVSGSNRLNIDSRTGDFRYQLQLPTGLTCTQCVLQWKYRTANHWGSDAFGSGLGHGPQEEFYGCADVAITGSGAPPPPPVAPPPPPVAPPPPPVAPPPTTTPPQNPPGTQNCFAIPPYSQWPGFHAWCQSTCVIPAACPASICHSGCRTGAPARVCRPTLAYTGVPGMPIWCQRNCLMGYCPPTHCVCT